jgi:N-acetylglucosamine-6-phosphate deacetylase
VRVAEGRIVAVAPVDAPAGAAQVIDVASGWIAPGLIDLQINGGLGHDFGTAPEAAGSVADWLPRTGVTAFLPTLITAPLEHLRRGVATLARCMTAPPTGAHMLGVHLEGPYLNPAFRGAHAGQWLRPPDIDELAALCTDRPVRLVTLAPELPGALAAVAWLCARGIVVSAGHSGATYDQARAAFAAGVTMGTHLFNAMTPFHHREPGLPGALLTEPGIRASLIADGLHVHPAALRLAYAARGAAGLALVSDAMAALGMGDGHYQLSGQAVTVDAESARLADGTLAGSVVPLDAALRTIVSAAGCSVAAAVRMASQTPAEVLGLTDRGRIAAGMRADLIVLDPALRVCLTVIAGRVVWEAGS